jgi:RNA polymerase sigma-70 factor (ECF subfamily)
MTNGSEAGPGAPPGERSASNSLAVFEQHRALLFSIAYRMLGSVADAEDAVQEAFLRWQRASESDIRSPRAFLVTVVSRLCINQLQSARARREEYVGEWLPEPLVTDPGSDPSEVARVDESVSMALLLLLERLSPAERAVFLLHEVFDLQHAEIAEALSVTEANSRQLLRRAQQHVQLARPRFRAPSGEHLELLQSFTEAARRGDLDHLVSMLSSDVVMHTDGGGKASALLLPIYGPDRVATATLHGLRKLLSLNVRQRVVEINGQPGVVSYRDGRPQSVFTIEAKDGRVRAIYIVTNPEKLSGVGRDLLDDSTSLFPSSETKTDPISG